MIAEVNATLTLARQAVARVQAIEAMLNQIQGCEGFAVVKKDGVSYFVLLNEDQSKVVNGTSITLDNLPNIKSQMLDLALEQLKVAMSKDKDLLKPFVNPPAPTPTPIPTPKVSAPSTKTTV